MVNRRHGPVCPGPRLGWFSSTAPSGEEPVTTKDFAAFAGAAGLSSLRVLKVIPGEVVTDAAPVYPACSTSWFPRCGTVSGSTPMIG